MPFTCQICFESQDNRLQLPRVATNNGDVMRKGDCDHPICRDCIATHVRIRVEDHRVFNLRCPFDGCTNELYEQDLRVLANEGLLSNDICSRFVDLRARDFAARAVSFDETIPQSDEDVEFLHRMRDMRLCPRCRLVMQRSEGCNSFYCICGEHFNYALAERAVANGVKHFRFVVALAKSQKVAVTEAAKYSGDINLFRKVRKTAEQLGLTCDQALTLHLRAQDGNVGARALIRKGRGTVPKPIEEKRIANDGNAYTRADFMRHYGKYDGQWYWDSCVDVAICPAIGEGQKEDIRSPSDFVVPVKLGMESTCVWVSLEKVIEAGANLTWPNAPARKVTPNRIPLGQPPFAKSEKRRERQANATMHANLYARLGRRKM